MTSLQYKFSDRKIGHKIWLIAMLFFSVASTARENISIAVLEIPYLASQVPEQRGLYNDFLDSLEDVTTAFAPPARAKLMFRRGSVDCIFPAGLTTYHVPFEIIQSTPVRTIRAHLYTRNEYRSFSVKKSDNIAIRRGFTFGGFRKKNPANYIDLDSDQSALKFLLKERVDAVVAYHPDIQLAAKEADIPMPFYQPSQPIYIAKDAILCRADGDTKRFLRKVEQPIKNFRAQQGIID